MAIVQSVGRGSLGHVCMLDTLAGTSRAVALSSTAGPRVLDAVSSSHEVLYGVLRLIMLAAQDVSQGYMLGLPAG